MDIKIDFNDLHQTLERLISQREQEMELQKSRGQDAKSAYFDIYEALHFGEKVKNLEDVQKIINIVLCEAMRKRITHERGSVEYSFYNGYCEACELFLDLLDACDVVTTEE